MLSIHLFNISGLMHELKFMIIHEGNVKSRSDKILIKINLAINEYKNYNSRNKKDASQELKCGSQ